MYGHRLPGEDATPDPVLNDFQRGPAPAEATSLFRNSFYLAMGKIAVLFSFGLFIFAARWLGAVRFGEFTLGLTIASILFTLPNWGTNRYSWIVAARRPEETEAIVARNLGLTSTLGLVYLPLTFAVAHLISGEPAVVWTAMLMAISLLLQNFAALLHAMFRVHDLYILVARNSVVEKFAVAAGGIGALLVSNTPASLAIGFILGHTCGAIAAAIPFRRRIGSIRLHFSVEPLWKLFQSGTPIALRNILSWANLRVDMLVLGAMAPAAQLGWYGAVYRLVDGTMMLPGVILGSLGPTLSASHGAGQKDVVGRLYRRGYKYLLIAALFLGGVFAVHGRDIMVLVFGQEYAPGHTSLRLLGIAITFIFLRQLAIEVMDNIDVRKATVFVFGGILVLNTALNILLVPRLGHMGAAAATLVAEAFLVLLLFGILRNKDYSAHPFRAAWRPVIAAGLAAGIMLLLDAWPIPGTLLAGTGYFLALTGLGTWDGKDRVLAGQISTYTRNRFNSWWSKRKSDSR